MDYMDVVTQNNTDQQRMDGTDHSVLIDESSFLIIKVNH